MSWSDATSTRVKIGLAGRHLTVRDDFLHADERAWLGSTSLPTRPLARFDLPQICRMFDGDIRLLWHNTSFVQPDDRALFEAILA